MHDGNGGRVLLWYSAVKLVIHGLPIAHLYIYIDILFVGGIKFIGEHGYDTTVTIRLLYIYYFGIFSGAVPKEMQKSYLGLKDYL